MSLRSRTLRARLLRLSRRAMRLTVHPELDETRGIASRTHFSKLIWRRRRTLRLPRETALALHRHESHFFIRPDVRVSVRLHLAASRAARAEGVWPGSMRHRWRDAPRAGISGRTRRAPFVPESLSSGPRMRRPPEASAHVVSVGQRVVTRVLTSWLQRAVDGAVMAHRAGPTRAAALLLPAVRPSMRGGPLESRSERRRLMRRESSALPHLTLHRLAVRKMREARMGGLRSPAFLPAARLRRREAAAGAVPGNRLTWREVAPVTLYYVPPRAMAAPTVQIEHTAAAPIVSHPARSAAQFARTAAAPMLDRAATDRLADEVIRRIERRVRMERERRGI